MATIYQHPDKRTVTVSVFPANRGLKSSISEALLAPEELSESNNIIHTTYATRRTRPGIASYYVSGFGSGEAVKWIMDFWRTSGTSQNQKVVAVTNGRIYADSADGTFVKIGDVASNSLTKNITGDVLVGFMVIGIEDEVPQKYIQGGATAALGGSPPTGGIVRKHKSRIFLTGVKTAPHTVYYSSVENPEEWSGGTSGSVNLDLGASDPYGNTAIFEDLFGELYVAKWNSIYQITTSASPFAVKPLLSTIGCISHNGVASTQNDVIFPSERGLHSLATTLNYGDVEAKYLSFPVHNIWHTLIDFTKAKQISGSFVPEYNSYLMCYPDRTGDNFNLLGYNVVTQDFFHWESFNATFITPFVDSSKRRRLMIGTNDGNIGIGRTIDDTAFLDFLTSFNTNFKTAIIFPGGRASGTFGFKELTVYFQTRSTDPIVGTYQIGSLGARTFSLNQGSPGILLGNFVLGDLLGAPGSLLSRTVPLTGYGNSIKLGFSTTPTNSTGTDGTALEVFGYDIECEKVGDTLENVAVG